MWACIEPDVCFIVGTPDVCFVVGTPDVCFVVDMLCCRHP